MLQPQKIRPESKAMMKFFTQAISMKNLGSYYGISQNRTVILRNIAKKNIDFTENRKS